MTIRDEAAAHLEAWPVGCGVAACDVCAIAGRSTNRKCLVDGCGSARVTGWAYCTAHVPGRKDDGGKTRWDLLPWAGLEQVAKVLTFGAKKYAPENWRKVSDWRWRYFRAAIGHVAMWWKGEKLDPESGLPHLAHAACCILFLLELDQ